MPDFTEIANRYLGIETLETRNSDRLDFHDVAAWSIKEALEAAYRKGQEDARPRPFPDSSPPLR